MMIMLKSIVPIGAGVMLLSLLINPRAFAVIRITSTSIQHVQTPQSLNLPYTDDSISLARGAASRYIPDSTEEQCTDMNCTYAQMVGLFKWEQKSRDSGKCDPPDGIPDYCCLGSKSGGSEMVYQEASCNENVEGYRIVEERALEYLDRAETGDCDVCQIIHHVEQNNLTLGFTGDSMTRQTFAGMECELRRRGYYVFVRNEKWSYGVSEDWNYGVGEFYHEMIVSRMPSPLGTKIHARIVFYPSYRPLLNDVRHLIANTNILVFDHGSHYNHMTDGEFGIRNEEAIYAKEMEALLSDLSSQNLKLIAWRETATQHFNSNGGHFPGQDVALRDRCVPLHGDSDAETAYMSLMRTAATKAGLTMRNAGMINFADIPLGEKELIMLPFREFTLPLHNLHWLEDCTHYCHTPHVWLPIWSSLRRAMDRSLA